MTKKVSSKVTTSLKQLVEVMKCLGWSETPVEATPSAFKLAFDMSGIVTVVNWEYEEWEVKRLIKLAAYVEDLTEYEFIAKYL